MCSIFDRTASEGARRRVGNCRLVRCVREGIFVVVVVIVAAAAAAAARVVGMLWGCCGRRSSQSSKEQSWWFCAIRWLFGWLRDLRE